MLYILHGGILMDRMTSEFAVYEALIREGAAIRMLPWTALPETQPGDTVAFRLVWGYDQKPVDFLNLVERVRRSGARMVPEPEVLRWNVHKKYLAALQKRGVSMPRCAYHAEGAFDAGWIRSGMELVVKPAISAGARGILRCTGDEILSGAVQIPDDVLVQVFSEEVSAGERSQIFLGGVYSHAVIKTPAAGDFRVQKIYGGTVAAYTPPEHERAWALDVLAKLPFHVDYARVDYLAGASGCGLMELELIEPELFLSTPDHAAAFARVVKGWL